MTTEETPMSTDKDPRIQTIDVTPSNWHALASEFDGVALGRCFEALKQIKWAGINRIEITRTKLLVDVHVRDGESPMLPLKDLYQQIAAAVEKAAVPGKATITLKMELGEGDEEAIYVAKKVDLSEWIPRTFVPKPPPDGAPPAAAAP